MLVQRRVLYFREAPHMLALIFASPERAEFVDRLHCAIEDSQTWGEFCRRLPPTEYENLFAEQFSTDAKCIAEDPECAHPADDAPFSSDSVPGYSDGDYPPWLATEQERHLPADVLQSFGTRQSSGLNGRFWSIPSEKRDAILETLRARGYELIERNDLRFW